MNYRISKILVVSILVSLAFVSFGPQGAIAPEVKTWTCTFTFNPNPGYYKETITFTGSAGCSDPIEWKWTFPGPVYKYGQVVYHSFAPDWEDDSYSVKLEVTNSSNITQSHIKWVPVNIEYDLTGSAEVSPRIAGTGTTITVDIEAINVYIANHYCPLGYEVDVKLYKYQVFWGYQYFEDVDTLEGECDLAYYDTEDLQTGWYAWQTGLYKFKIIFDTREDVYTTNNYIWSDSFSII